MIISVYIMKPLVAAGGQVAKNLVVDSIAANETAEEIGKKMRLGIIISAGMASLYIAPILFKSDSSSIFLTAVFAFNEFLPAIARTANEEQSAFRQEDQNWWKTAGDVAKIIIPISGALYLWIAPKTSRTKEAYALIQIIAALPAIFNIISAWSYGNNSNK